MQRPAKFLVAIIAGLSFALVSAELRAGPYVIEEVMSGLVTPRGLAFGPDGGLYVAEAGSGGDGPGIVLGSGNEAFLGATSGLSRLLGGVQERVLDGLPSVATAAGLEANGLADIAFDANGQAYGLFGLGANPALRNSNLGDAGAPLGTIVRMTLDGTGTLTPIADVSDYELANNPDGTTVDSNPFDLTLTDQGDFLIADAGGNNFLQATVAGVVTSLRSLPARPNPGPIGPPVFSAVPTAISVGPDGAYYIGQLTGFPFPPGLANVYRFDPATDELTEAYTGFTNIMDLAFDADGNLLVLQLTTNGLASPNGPGSGLLVMIDALTGERTTIADAGLVFPGKVLVGPAGEFYVTNHTNTPTGGQVLRLSPVPEPSTLLLAGMGALALVVTRRRDHAAT
jgi:hypothetical protein